MMSHSFLFVGIWAVVFGYGVWRFSPSIFTYVRRRLPAKAKHAVPSSEGMFDLVSSIQRLVFRGMGMLGMAGGTLLMLTWFLWLLGFDVFTLLL